MLTVIKKKWYLHTQIQHKNNFTFLQNRPDQATCDITQCVDKLLVYVNAVYRGNKVNLRYVQHSHYIALVYETIVWTSNVVLKRPCHQCKKKKQKNTHKNQFFQMLTSSIFLSSFHKLIVGLQCSCGAQPQWLLRCWQRIASFVTRTLIVEHHWLLRSK